MIAVAVVVVLIVALVVWLANRGSSPDVDSTAADTPSESVALTGVLAPTSDAQPTEDILDSFAVPSMDDPLGGSGSVSTESGAGTTGSSAPKSTPSSGPATSTATTTAQTTKDAKTTPADKAGGATTTSPSSTTKPSKTTKTTPTATSTPPPPPSYDDSGRLICPDSAIKLTAATRSTTYPVGAFPVLTLTVTNRGPVPCVRDVSGTLQVFTVYTSQGDRVWSTDDCFPGTGTEVHRFTAGEHRTYPVTWSGTTSEPGCPANRVQVKPGKYTVVAALGSLKSKPAAFAVTG